MIPVAVDQYDPACVGPELLKPKGTGGGQAKFGSQYSNILARPTMLRRFPPSHSNTAASVYSSSECGYLLLDEGFRPVYGQANRVDIAKTKTHVSNLLVRNAREA